MPRPMLRIAAVAALMAGMAVAAGEPLELVIDADYSIAADGARAIESGVRAALEERDYRLGGLPVRVRSVDHRGNAKRSLATMKQYLDSDRALAMVGGIHSPPYLGNRDFINDAGILLLLPWSAAAPITRAGPGRTNWIFRLSVDDARAGDVLVGHAVDTRGCSRPALLLVDTSWGRSNRALLEAALARRGKTASAVVMFPSTIGAAAAASVAAGVSRSGADCAILLATAVDGAVLLPALHAQGRDIRVISHWGILAGNFPAMTSPDVREAVRLEVLETCGLRAEALGSAALARALATDAARPATRLSDIRGSVGFVHGHDLAQLLVAAADQIAERPDWIAGDIATRRGLLRDALEHLAAPVEGILRTYRTPFSPYRPDRPDSHEALGSDDLCMARFAADGTLVAAF